MPMSFRSVRLLSLGLSLVACQSVPPGPPAPAPPLPAAAQPGLAFAQATCGSCHEVGRSGHSSNPNSPPFMAIVNQDGLTEDTLTTWLRGAHNYPSEMDFYLTDAQVRELVAYMLTLRDPTYRRAPD